MNVASVTFGLYSQMFSEMMMLRNCCFAHQFSIFYASLKRLVKRSTKGFGFHFETKTKFDACTIVRQFFQGQQKSVFQPLFTLNYKRSRFHNGDVKTEAQSLLESFGK